jgi:hypothetical protein
VSDDRWFAAVSDDEDAVPGAPWQPFLQIAGGCFPLPMWFATEAECWSFIGTIPQGRSQHSDCDGVRESTVMTDPVATLTVGDPSGYTEFGPAWEYQIRIDDPLPTVGYDVYDGVDIVKHGPRPLRAGDRVWLAWLCIDRGPVPFATATVAKVECATPENHHPESTSPCVDECGRFVTVIDVEAWVAQRRAPCPADTDGDGNCALCARHPGIHG